MSRREIKIEEIVTDDAGADQGNWYRRRVIKLAEIMIRELSDVEENQAEKEKKDT